MIQQQSKIETYYINDQKFNDTLGLKYVVKNNETRQFKGIKVTETAPLVERLKEIKGMNQVWWNDEIAELIKELES